MLDFSFWEQATKKGFNFDLPEGEVLEVARVDKNKERAYLKFKNEVYSLNIKFPFDFKKLNRRNRTKSKKATALHFI